MFIVDASVTLSWCFEDEATDASEALLRRLLMEGGLAPGHWPFEVTNALISGERRGRLDEARLSVARSLLAALPVDIAPSDMGAALGIRDMARQHDLTVYDAAYLELATARSVGLATVDERLAAACRAAGVSVIA